MIDGYLELNGKQLPKRTSTGRALSSSSLPRPRLNRTAFMHSVEAAFVYTPSFPPQMLQSVDNSIFYALSDSDFMTPLDHQAGTLRCKAEPETARRSGTERMQDHQISWQTVRENGKCSRGGGYEENEYRVRLAALKTASNAG